MPKRNRNKKGQALSRGPFGYRELDREFRRIGYKPAKPGDHMNLKHPDRPGKVQLDTKWENVKVGGWVWRYLCRQSGYSKKELQRILNGLDP
jgi:hypothetical protein